MRSYRDAIQTVYDPIGIRYRLYTTLQGVLYMLYTIIYVLDTGCIRSYGHRYRLYTIL